MASPARMVQLRTPSLAICVWETPPGRPHSGRTARISSAPPWGVEDQTRLRSGTSLRPAAATATRRTTAPKLGLTRAPPYKISILRPKVGSLSSYDPGESNGPPSSTNRALEVPEPENRSGLLAPFSCHLRHCNHEHTAIWADTTDTAKTQIGLRRHLRPQRGLRRRLTPLRRPRTPATCTTAATPAARRPSTTTTTPPTAARTPTTFAIDMGLCPVLFISEVTQAPGRAFALTLPPMWLWSSVRRKNRDMRLQPTSSPGLVPSRLRTKAQRRATHLRGVAYQGPSDPRLSLPIQWTFVVSAGKQPPLTSGGSWLRGVLSTLPALVVASPKWELLGTGPLPALCA